jgi:hypothetical protein
MTPTPWQTASANDLLQALQGRLSPRQMRLIACAYARGMPAAARASSAQALDVAERFADGKATAHQLAAARFGGRFQPGHPAWAVCWAPDSDDLLMLERALAWAAGYVGSRVIPYYRRLETGEVDGGRFREVAGHLLQPVTLDPGWLAWSDGTVGKLARAIYDGRDFAQMPILGDALEEAGCADARLLEHCRGNANHVRGCWLLDQLLGLS